MAAKPGSIVHVELHSADPAKSRQFYGQVFGWKFEDIPGMNYTMWKAPNEPAGGLGRTQEGQPPQVLNYILSDSVENTLDDIANAGGIVLTPKTEIPGQGWWAIFREPGGTMMAIYQGLPQPPPPRAARKAKARTAAKKGGKKAGRKKRR